MRALILIPAAALAAVGLASGCAPVPGRVAVTGDSTMFQALYYSTSTVDDGWDHGQLDTANDPATPNDDMVQLGAEAEDLHPDVQRAVDDPNRSPEVLVVAVGHNDAATGGTGVGGQPRDGWTDTDALQVLSLLAAPEDGVTCTVAVLPGYRGSDPVHAAGIAAMRTFVAESVALNPDSMVAVDWQPVIDTHPEYLASDGVHLSGAAEASNAFVELIHTGVDRCFGVLGG